MTALTERIMALIEAQGPISVAQYMTLALHDPKEGYYASREPFGVQGDFITAPEVSQMFGELVGLWCGQVWSDQERPKGAKLVELGPGRGTLMADALSALKHVPGFLDQAEVVLVESSARLQAMQRERLEGSKARLSWRAHFDIADAPLLLLANEFFDALPLRQYVKTARGWCERMVVVKQGALDFALAPQPVPAAAVPAYAPDGGVYEVSHSALALAEEIGRLIQTHGGGALIVDYGYAERGFGETLQAVGAHRFQPLLAEPGRHDLSAHVDFTALGQAARRGGAQTFGPVAQGPFLERLGIGSRAERLAAAHPAERQAINAALERLTAPNAMGNLFQAMAVLPSAAPPPPGFC